MLKIFSVRKRTHTASAAGLLKKRIVLLMQAIDQKKKACDCLIIGAGSAGNILADAHLIHKSEFPNKGHNAASPQDKQMLAQRFIQIAMLFVPGRGLTYRLA